MKIILFFHVPGCSGMFRNVPACSEMFRVPGFIDAHLTMTTAETRNQKTALHQNLIEM